MKIGDENVEPEGLRQHRLRAFLWVGKMASNLDRFKKDLDRLIDLGGDLHLSMLLETSKDEFTKQIQKVHGKDANDFIKKLPKFSKEYEAWYSESLALLRQLLPDRIENFISFYEKPKGRKKITYATYVIQDYLRGLVVKDGYGDYKVDTSAAVTQFQQQYNIVKAAKIRFESKLFEIRQLVQADLFDSELEAARELHKNKFLRAAGAVTGLVLEKHLRQVCEDRAIKIAKKNPGISDLNELLKSNGVIEIPQWRHISMLGDLRNLCDHSKSKEPKPEQVSDLIDGTEKVLKTVF
jgi:hypothetical protein